MALKIYVMKFHQAHFGNGYLNSSIAHFTASRLFSALCLEAIKNNCLDEFIAEANQPDFVLSDAFPFIERPYLPKPVSYPNFDFAFESLDDNIQKQKLADSLYAVPLDEYHNFLQGTADMERFARSQANFSKTVEITKKGEDPYEVAVTYFKGSLYVIAKQSQIVDQLMTSLQYSGLGGKRSSGYGSFELRIGNLPSDLADCLCQENDERSEYVLLTTSFPRKEELDQVLPYAKYEIYKESGFAYSETEQELLRKQDFYKFKAGSIFKRAYHGYIADVRPDGFDHPVYNFAKGLFYKIGG
ncbi:Csm4 family CRISPR-associated ramp protein [Lactobacillus equicursoris 66c]|uniref:CRISPR system Cms protein Csm4 n=1 Tax=Lactobacillus equicursoris 66c TaxID=872326 RepID=K0NXQ4_9LACO|nr:type III-A CRISPR-associated RAMP protein Csm4 [Lactobacillus equicursoris]CCK84275.1 Csm4 family CRISPR-associated ramp protein [Lactobacillus equicursoris 66c]